MRKLFGPSLFAYWLRPNKYKDTQERRQSRNTALPRHRVRSKKTRNDATERTGTLMKTIGEVVITHITHMRNMRKNSVYNKVTITYKTFASLP